VDFQSEAAEQRSALAAASKRLPPLARGPTQFLGRQYAGCGAVIGAMPKCDFACSGCYLNSQANQATARSVDEIKRQLDQIRNWLGPAGNVQITDGEVSLREESELVAIIRHARTIGLVPMLMSHGETFRRRSGLLERLMERGGLTEISIHVDITQRGRRDAYAKATTEEDLNGLRREFADLIRTARRRTGQRLEAASTVTVTRDNIGMVPGLVQWFLANADAFKMVSFQPLAPVGRTEPALRGVSAEALWEQIAMGTGNPGVRRGEGWLGHPECSKFVQGLSFRRDGSWRLMPLYHRDDPAEMRTLSELLDRLGGTSFRLDAPGTRRKRWMRLLSQHGGFALRRLLPQGIRLLRRTGTVRSHYFCIVSHHFMSREEIQSDRGQERLNACVFKVPIHGKLEPMCAVNALGLREQFYAQANRTGRNSAVPA
jgi:hypothetical protein